MVVLLEWYLKSRESKPFPNHPNEMVVLSFIVEVRQYYANQQKYRRKQQLERIKHPLFAIFPFRSL